MSIEVTRADWDLLIHIIAPDIDTLEQINAGQAFALEVQWIAEHRLKAARYWYRQGKDDGADAEVAQIVTGLRGLSGVPDSAMLADWIERGEYKPEETSGE